MNFLLFIAFLNLFNLINAQIDLNLIDAEILHKNSDTIWDSETYPNPLSDDGLLKCNNKNKTYLCDPENILSETAQKNIINELKELQTKTSKDFNLWRIFQKCNKQGLIGAVGIANRFAGGNSRTLKFHANDLLKKWKMDEICEKSFLILLSIKDRSFWIAKDSNIPIHSNFFTQLFNEQKEELRSENYETAIINIIRSISIASEKGSKKDGFGIEMIFFYLKYMFIAFAIIGCILCCRYCVKCTKADNGYQSGTTATYDTSNNNNNYHESNGCNDDNGGGGNGDSGRDSGGGGGGDW